MNADQIDTINKMTVALLLEIPDKKCASENKEVKRYYRFFNL
jgi:hypothetical protein